MNIMITQNILHKGKQLKYICDGMLPSIKYMYVHTYESKRIYMHGRSVVNGFRLKAKSAR